MDTFEHVVREILLERFGADIEDATASYSTHNCAFIFPTDFIIRVNTCSKSHEDAYWLGELLFLTDAYQKGADVCAPLPSLSGKLLEKFEAGDKACTAVKFIKAKGATVRAENINTDHARTVGAALGHIHRVSCDAARAGHAYHRPSHIEVNGYLLERVDSKAAEPWLTVDVKEKMRTVLSAVHGRPSRPAESYGLIHADFTPFNYYVQGENIQVFDFDDCYYGFYIYDIATLILLWLTQMADDANLCAAATYQKLLSAFREGYEQHMSLAQDEWERLPLFMQYRQAVMILHVIDTMVTGQGKTGGSASGYMILPPMVEAFAQDDLFVGIDHQTENARRRKQTIVRLLSGEMTPDDPESANLLQMLNSDDVKPFINAMLGSVSKVAMMKKEEKNL